MWNWLIINYSVHTHYNTEAWFSAAVLLLKMLSTVKLQRDKFYQTWHMFFFICWFKKNIKSSNSCMLHCKHTLLGHRQWCHDFLIMVKLHFVPSSIWTFSNLFNRSFRLQIQNMASMKHVKNYLLGFLEDSVSKNKSLNVRKMFRKIRKWLSFFFKFLKKYFDWKYDKYTW